MADLLNVDEALNRILAPIKRLPAETVNLDDAWDRVIAEDITAATDVPPFDNSSMDGFALHSADTLGATQAAPISLTVAMDIPAGAHPMQTLLQGQAARIMTGAPLPPGADAVIAVEQTDAEWVSGQETPLPTHVRMFRAVSPGANVRRTGEDIRQGQRLIPAGDVVRPPSIGVIASLGMAHVRVVRQPQVAILSNGDELLAVGEPPEPGRVYNSNSHSLAALVAACGAQPHRLPTARDTLEAVRALFRQALEIKPDVIVSSAGVSVGAFDVVHTVLSELGQVDFWKINLRPGKPLAFGTIGGIPFFGLPGNPVSAMVTFEVFVRPTLLKMAGRRDSTATIEARLDEDITSDGRRSYLRVLLRQTDEGWFARLTGTQSSGALTSMLQADGLMIVPEGITYQPAGSRLPVRLLRDVYP